MEVLTAWLFLFLQTSLLYLFWIAYEQAPKTRYLFDDLTPPTGALVNTDPPDDYDVDKKLKSDPIEDAGANAKVLSSNDSTSKDGKSDLQIWGQTTMSKWGSEESMERKRALIINEIIQTEESYLNSLHQLSAVWIKPMTKSASEKSNGLALKDIQMLSFTSVEMIIALHDAFLPQLRAAADVGAAFVRFGDFLKMYTAFVNSYDNILQVLGSLRKRKKFQSFAQKIRAANPNVASLESFMIMPIQRVPRYMLLLRELKRNTPEFHHDYPALATATDRVAMITAHINSAKANFENVTKIIQIQNRLVGYDEETSLIKSGRLFVHEGHLAVRKQLSGFSPIGRSTVDCVVYLFTDICLWTSTSHRFKGVLDLHETKLEASQDDLDIKLCARHQEITFVADSEPTRTAWIARVSPLLGE